MKYSTMREEKKQTAMGKPNIKKLHLCLGEAKKSSLDKEKE